jgi:RimJ/RimL family protein N-acetyltransferase
MTATGHAPEALTTTRLTLTPLAVSDADTMVDVLADERMYEFTGGRPLTLDELRTRYRRLAAGVSSDGTERWFNWIARLTDDATAVGVMQATVATDESQADVAWEIGTPWQGRGLASEAAVGVVAWIERRYPAAVIQATIHPDHVASKGVATRAGLAPTTEWIDGEIVWRRST